MRAVTVGLLTLSGPLTFAAGWALANPLLLFLSVPVELIAGGALTLLCRRDNREMRKR